MTKFKKLIKPFIIFYLFLCILLGASYAIQGSLKFDADISRDFLLMDEVSNKTIMLIGPRASGIPGVFHGPLWIYLNYPAYYLGQANPAVVSWSWVVLIVIFLTTSYLLIKKASSKKTALIFTLLMSGMLIPWMHQLLNPFGALALMPTLVFLVMKYQETKKIGYWAGIILTLGMMIQFQMAVGGPVTILVILWLSYWMYKEKRLKHLLLLPLFLIPLASFIIFDLRHDFAQTKVVINFVNNGANVPLIPMIDRVNQRIQLWTRNGMHFFTSGILDVFNLGIFITIIIQLTTNKFKLKKMDKKLLGFLFYLYSGFYLISTLFNGNLLVYYWWPLVPLSYLMFAIILSNAKNKYLTITFALVLLINLISGVKFAIDSKNKVGQIEDDWAFQKNMTEQLFVGEESEFGYFIFTPDVFAYESKAAMTYSIKNHPEKTVARYQKKPVTYLIIAPNPTFRPDIKSYYWKKDRLNMEATPSATFLFPDGYKVEKYFLDEDQIAKEPNSTIDDWLHFR